LRAGNHANDRSAMPVVGFLKALYTKGFILQRVSSSPNAHVLL
jgi:hypothetical protein